MTNEAGLEFENMQKDDGGPAFPVSLDDGDDWKHYAGMSLRDYMAIHCPHDEVPNLTPANLGEDITLVKCISRYQWADAMLKARKK